MAALYSRLLWDPGPVALGTYNSPTVAVNTEWQIRDIVAVNTGSVQAVTQGLTCNVHSTGSYLVWIAKPYALNQWMYHLEMRQSVQAGDYLVLSTYDSGWSFRVSGYLFTLP